MVRVLVSRYAGFIPLLPLLLLSACAAGPDFVQPVKPPVDRLISENLPFHLAVTPGVVGGEPQTYVIDKDVPANWWTFFQSAELNQMVAQSLQKNPTLQAADAALRVAQFSAQSVSGILLPSVGLGAGVSRQQVPPAALGSSQGSPVDYNLYNATVNVSYRLDLFGGVRRTVEGAQAQAEFQKFQLEAAYLSLTSNVVNAAIRDASQKEQLEATRTILEAQKNLAQLIQQQYKIGSVSKIDISSQNTLVANSQTQLYAFDKNLAITKNMLIAYMGGYPGTNQIPELKLASLRLPSQIPLVLPSNLVRQRPDIRAAEAALKASNAQVGVATANLLPQFNLSAAYGAEALSSAALFGPGSVLWSLGAGLTQPIFQGGALTAQKNAATAAFEQASANYQAVVVSAFQDVANALKALDTSANTLASTADAEKNAGLNLALVTEQYKLGAINYLAVLNAQTQYQQAKINLIQAQADRFTSTAALYAALGGGWWNRTGPAYSSVQPKDAVQMTNTNNQPEVK